MSLVDRTVMLVGDKHAAHYAELLSVLSQIDAWLPGWTRMSETSGRCPGVPFEATMTAHTRTS
jgi:hypothetical protein